MILSCPDMVVGNRKADGCTAIPFCIRDALFASFVNTFKSRPSLSRDRLSLDPSPFITFTSIHPILTPLAPIFHVFLPKERVQPAPAPRALESEVAKYSCEFVPVIPRFALLGALQAAFWGQRGFYGSCLSHRASGCVS